VALSLAAAVVPTAAPSLGFGPGESLSYAVTNLGAPAGTARIDVGAAALRAGAAAWPLVVTVRSEGLAEKLYPVRERYVDWWDPATALAVESGLSTSEGGQRSGFHIRFERQTAWPDGGVAADVELWSGSERETARRPVDPAAQDILSATFWLRTRPLSPGDRYEVPVFMGKAQWPLGATVLGRETVATAAGSFDCIHVRLSASLKGRLGNRRDLDAYFSADPRHLPVLLDSELLIGRLRVSLTGVQGDGVVASH
jgi:hypothetical protein